MERQEYTAETYPSFGKKYNGEKAIISLTSWKARINTVSKTLYSLIKQCPGFHIVLVLSEEEFPKMMKELPESLKLFVDNELIEILWVYKNYKAFKKVLFTMDKYREVPVISADDDCIYTCNYAQTLYDKWVKNKNKVILYKSSKIFHLQGTSTLYPPRIIPVHISLLNMIKTYMKKSSSDDTFFTNVLKTYFDIKYDCVSNTYPFVFHDENKPLHPEYKHTSCFSKCYTK